ncbi:kinase-like protein, partial [Rhizopogon salebrosus TDB-379]
IERELRLWAILEHVNILPLYGCTNGFGPYPALVSPWAENGNLTSYLELKYGRLTMVDKFNILRDVAAGLQYHTYHFKLIQCQLKANVLIHHDGTACIADFGLSMMYSEALGVLSQASSSSHGTIRWMAPELFEVPEDGLPVCPSKQGDIYSFGGIMLLVLTGKIPYYYFSYEPAIIGIIYSSVKPERARYILVPDKHWEFIEECWSTDIQHRPSIERVVQMVRDELELICAGAHA